MALDFTKIITSLMVVLIIGVGLFFTIITIGDNYSTPRGEKFNTTFDQFELTFNSTLKETTTVQEASEGTQASQVTTSGFAFSSAITSLKLMWNFYSFADNLLNTLADAIGLPPIFLQGFFAILIIVITLLFLKAVFGVKP